MEDLFRAIDSLDIQKVNESLTKDTDINQRDDYQYTPLMRLADSSLMPPEPVLISRIATLLIDAGANLYAVNNHGVTALWLAVQAGNYALVKVLTDQGQSVLDQMSLNEFLDKTFPRHPSRQQRLEFSKVLDQFLAETPSLVERNERGLTPLCIACKEGNSYAIEQLLAAGASPNMLALSGCSPLEFYCNYAWRARSEGLTSIQNLLQAGANPNNESIIYDGDDKKSALIWALYSGGNTEKVVRLLLDNNANPHAQDHHGVSVYEYAKRTKRPELIKAVEEYL